MEVVVPTIRNGGKVTIRDLKELCFADTETLTRRQHGTISFPFRASFHYRSLIDTIPIRFM